MHDKFYDYDRGELAGALRQLGVKLGDIIFSHVGMGFCGVPKEGRSLDTMFEVIYGAFRDVLGPRGTLIVPTFTYSFCNNHPYDVKNSPSTVGYFTERFRKMPSVKRSVEPLFSVAGIGPAVGGLFKNLPMDSFGPDCIYDRLTKAGAALCNIGVGFRYATFVHHVECMKGVSYRAPKIFSGEVIDGKRRFKTEITYYARAKFDDKSTYPDLTRLERDAAESGYLRYADVGRGRATYIKCKDMLDLCARGIDHDPGYLARGKRDRSHE